MKTYKQEVEKPRLEIFNDNCPESPREWANVGYFFGSHRSYETPDTEPAHIYQLFKEYWGATGDMQKDIRDLTQAIPEEVLFIEPISLYEHGQRSYTLGVKRGFDSGVFGLYIVTKESIKETGAPKDKIRELVKGELETYTEWANGEVYAYVLYNEKGEFQDALSGLYSFEEIREYLPKEWSNENLREYYKQGQK